MLSHIITNSASYALLEDSKSSPSKAKNLLFSDPKEEIIASDIVELPAALEKIEELKKQGLFLCGFMAYEAGYYFLDKKIENTKKGNSKQPLLYFIAFKKLHRPTRKELNELFDQQALFDDSELCIHDLSLNNTENKYIRVISTIKEYITAGDTYQINYTIKYRFKLQGDSTLLYRALRQTQPVEFGALLNFPQSKIVSLSPELFIHKKGNILTSKPMKGTAKRGENKEQDKKQVAFLKADPKTLSENVMIVDLIRNDFGRICKTGSVKVKNLFQVQTFKSIHQMISTVKGSLRSGLTFTDILTALFPCGSITGAPKIRTMEIINELEDEARGIYTGAIGYLLPNDDFYFNVPIRTIVVDNEQKTCEMGIGSGIIYESDAHDEFAECLLKANFLRSINQHFYLIETFRYDAKTNAFNNLEKHLERLSSSASYFGFELTLSKIKSELSQLQKKLATKDDGSLYKVRLLSYQNGEIRISYETLPTNSDTSPKIVTINKAPIDSSSVFQYHKTSQRKHYNDAYDIAEKQGFYEVIFFNEKNQLAEASRHNLFIKKDGRYFTPLLSAGILNGIERETFIKENKVEEVHLTKNDLLNADEILLTNSVRGVVKVELHEK